MRSPLRKLGILEKPRAAKTIHTMVECNYMSSREMPERRKTRHDGSGDDWEVGGFQKASDSAVDPQGPDTVLAEHGIYKYPG